MFTKTKSLLFITATLLISLPIQAAPKMDANGDDEISRIEYMSFKSNAFNKEDKNFDGRLTKQEIREARTERLRENAKKRFKEMDANGDGTITEAEHDDVNATKAQKRDDKRTEDAEKWFDNMDADNNGYISRLEYSAFIKTQTEKQQERSLKSSQNRFKRMDLDGDGVVTEIEYVDKGRKPGSSKKPDPMAGLYANDTAKPKKRTRRDGNSDGEITKREDRAYNEYQFDRLDKNKDGVITKKEGSFLFKAYGTGGDIIIDHQRLTR